MGSTSSRSGEISQYSKTLYYDPQADQYFKENEYYIHDKDLYFKINELKEMADAICNIEVYKENINNIQITKVVYYHAFIVVISEGYYWSFEKNCE